MRPSFAILTLLLFSTLGCNIPGSGGDDTSRSISELVSPAGEPLNFDDPIPNLSEALYQRVAAGKLSETEAVIAGLRILALEIEPEDILGEQVFEFDGGFGLTMQAFNLYQTLSDEKDKTEIDRLMDILAPSQARLDLYAVPENEVNRPPSNTLISLRKQAVPCESIWDAGFPDVSDPPTCLLYRAFTIGSHEYRVYYPTARRSDVGFMSHVDAAVTALRETIDRLSPYSEVPSINVIFTTEQLAGHPRVQASVPAMDVRLIDGVCPISVYPSLTSFDIPIFKFVMSHEVWHCITLLRIGSFDYGIAKWYIEGMAEYFANVVYPTLNFEHKRLLKFHKRSAVLPIYKLSYDAFIFFQYLESRFDTEYVIDLLDALPTHGDQASALAGISNMQDIFHEFSRAYLTSKVADSGGGMLPGPEVFPVLPDHLFEIDDSGVAVLDAEAFVVERFVISLNSGSTYEIQQEESGTDGLNGWRTLSQSSFSSIPSKVSVSCEDDFEYLPVLTSASTGSSTLELEFESDEEKKLDCCLVGTWEQPSHQIRINLETIMAGSGMSVVSVSGRFVVLLGDDHSLFFFPDGYAVVLQAPDEPPMTVSVVGLNTAFYFTPEEGVIRTTDDAPNFVVSITSQGHTVNLPLDADSLMSGPFSSPDTFAYTCTETTLTTFTGGAAPFASTTFNRITEEVTPPDSSEFPSPEDTGDDTGDITSMSTCGTITMGSFILDSDSVTWTISNTSTAAAEISGFSLYWPVSDNGAWVNLALSGSDIWTGSELESPGILFTFSGDAVTRTILAGSSAQIVMDFANTPIAAEGYTSVVNFTNGCIISDFQ